MNFILFFFINMIKILKYAILVRILMSWIRPARHGKISRLIYQITEPVLKVCRNILPRTGILDFSPLLAFFALDFAQMGIISIFSQL